ncbi:protein MODIFIED TRANSPORT TO THE VACUOLE 1-like [Aristolochia californica]|uniref:protein MODIFIED TRANSPORT TO THE VACUOLE 1-like n=1 Tax=Aristolochia californica TaxID=171875 RepID=UPI0035D72065
MDSSRRAVESYWRSRMIDGVTLDEDKVAPVYKLEEICELLRTSHVSIVKEVSEFILKRLDHKSPIVKQKVLRLIKYSVGKSGVEYRREMQRHSTAIRQLFHYKGHSDPLKGDALNKAVRDTAHEAVIAVFASEDNKPAATEDINKRIKGFGNTNFEMPTEDKKSFLSEVVGLGSASLRQGLSTITSAHSLRKNDAGSYQSPNLRRSLTKEMDRPGRYEREEHSRGTWDSSSLTVNIASGPWGQDLRPITQETTNGESGPSHSGGKSREERLLDTIVTSGGVRLQPTRDALQVFLTEALKVDAIALSLALEMKLQSHMWQVRMKALCVLDAILKKKDDAHFSIIASFFSEKPDTLLECSETPLVSLREKANKVLSLLNVELSSARNENPSAGKVEAATRIDMPDLIDTSEPDDRVDRNTTEKINDLSDLTTSVAPEVDNLFGGNFTTNASESKDDPFADVSFHTTEDREQDVDNLFSGLIVDKSKQADGMTTNMPTSNSHYKHELLDVLGSNTKHLTPESQATNKNDVNELMAGLSLNASSAPLQQQQSGTFAGVFSETDLLRPTNQSSHSTFGLHSSQSVNLDTSQRNPLFALGAMQYNIPSNVMFDPAFGSQTVNYNILGSFLAQQQLLTTMSNFQNLGNHSGQVHPGLSLSAGGHLEGMSSPHPDIFNVTNNQAHSLTTTASSIKKEDTKAFDFISEHLSAARDPKRVV